MSDLSLHGFDKELELRLAEIARREGVSMNEAALRLLRRGAGLADAVTGPVGEAFGLIRRTLVGDGRKDTSGEHCGLRDRR